MTMMDEIEKIFAENLHRITFAVMMEMIDAMIEDLVPMVATSHEQHLLLTAQLRAKMEAKARVSFKGQQEIINDDQPRDS